MEQSNHVLGLKDIADKQNLWELLSRGAAIITPNNRLSGAILQDYFMYCNHPTVDKPVCLPYTTALTQTYQQLIFHRPEHTHPILINKSQCLHLWRKIIKSTASITYSDGLLHSITESWKHCEQWQISPEDPIFQYTPQTHQFQLWWQEFNVQLKKQHLIHEYQIISYVIKSKASLFPSHIIWACFDDFTPEQISLQNHIYSLGAEQFHYDLKENNTQSELLAAKDLNEEHQQLIAWLQLKLEEGKQRIGVVVPELQQRSQFIQRILQQHISPELFNLSLGQALSEFPLVSHALAWLNLHDNQLTLQQAVLLLQSPYTGYAKEEFIVRSQYLQDSSYLLNQTISLQRFIKELSSSAPKLAEQLKQLHPYPEKGSPQDWISCFEYRLNALGFPGDYGLNSENYQCINRFTSLFDEFRQLQVITPVMTKNEALEAFKQLAEHTIFQAQTTNAPIQISGLLEASGCEFDCLWVMGLTDQCLPQKTRLSPFIPHPLQRDLLMPHSVPERELKFARQTINRLKNGCSYAIFSYPRLQGDNPHLPSTLIAKLPKYQLIQILQEQQETVCIISEEETYIVPIGSDELISGGTALLANQAKCPFKAFAEQRLKAQPTEHASDGIDNKERGQIHHKVMELLWHQLKSQQHLLQLSQDALNQSIDQAIHIALSPLQTTHPDSFPDLIQSIEYSRIKKIVLSCLEWEKQRPSFSIEALEQSYSIHLSGIEFKVRVDRIDQVDGKKWIIDYKSSLPTSKPWNEERPKEPQLLLYALLDEHINALILMQLKSGKINCSGISENKQDIQGISSLKKEETWEDYRSYWSQQLSLLAEEFKQGLCLPNPVNLTVCKTCNFQNLCRFQANE